MALPRISRGDVKFLRSITLSLDQNKIVLGVFQGIIQFEIKHLVKPVGEFLGDLGRGSILHGLVLGVS